MFRTLCRGIAVVVSTTAVPVFVTAGPAFAQAAEPPAPSGTEEVPKIPNDQLDSLVAPVALYPDPLLAQVLAASTYPLEIIQLEQWLKRHSNLKQDALANEVAKQHWDSSVQSLAILPDVVTRLSQNVAWTTDLGNVFLAQPSDVMAAVQRMRAKAKSKGTLETTPQQTVETETAEGGGEVIMIEPANPQYVYVPSYDPAVVYGPPIYPYPPYYYPGYVPGMGLAFGTGLILGAAWANHWGDCNWGHGDVTINNKNNFNRNNINNVNGGNRNQIANRPSQGAGGKWQHNPAHRGGAPYGDRRTASQYGGRARQQPAGGAGNRSGGGSLGSNRPGGASGVGSGAGNIGAGNRPGGGGAGAISGIGPNRADGSSVFGGAGSNRAAGGSGSSFGDNAFRNNAFGNGAGGNRPGAGASTMPANRAGSGNSIGNRSISSGSGMGSSRTVFGGEGFGGGSARSASSRGGHSMGGGGFSRGGGGGGGLRGGGGMRGGGGGRR